MMREMIYTFKIWLKCYKITISCTPKLKKSTRFLVSKYTSPLIIANAKMALCQYYYSLLPRYKTNQ